MAPLPQDRRGQALLMLTVFAAALLYFAACGAPYGDVPGVVQLTARRDTLQRSVDTLQAKVDSAKAVVGRGEVEQLEARLLEGRATLDLIEQLVPAGAEINNLLDDISSRAKVRGANVSNFEPQPLESGAPFDTQRARFVVRGSYDQIGEYLADVASLPRIVVPYDLRLSRITSPTADTTLRAQASMLQASFSIRTYVKQVVVEPAPGGSQ